MRGAVVADLAAEAAARDRGDGRNLVEAEEGGPEIDTVISMTTMLVVVGACQECRAENHEQANKGDG